MAANSALPAGFRLAELAVTRSTNADCVTAANAGEAGNLWIRADRQTAGRGSRGRDWVSEKGNLFTSLLIDLPARTVKLPTLTFAASLALADALSETVSTAGTASKVTVKWPNDVLLAGGKIAGILLESHLLGERHVAVIGFGVNCASHPDETTHRATSLAAQGPTAQGLATTPQAFLPVLARHMALRLDAWRWGHGFGAIRTNWLELAAGLGEQMDVRLPNETVRGRFDTIDEEGLIVVADKNGLPRRFSVADIFLLTGETAGR